MSGYAIRCVLGPLALNAGELTVEARAEEEARAFELASIVAAALERPVDVLRTFQGQAHVPYAVVHPDGRVE